MNPETKKKVLRQICYGVYVLTARSGDEVAAATVTWLSQASFAPPLVMVCLKAGSHIHDLVERTGVFAVGVVGAAQQELAAAFFRPGKLEDGRLNGYAIEAAPATGAPLLTDLPYWFEARVTDAVHRGDHTVLVAEVIDAGLRDPAARPLVLADTPWSYGG